MAFFTKASWAAEVGRKLRGGGGWRWIECRFGQEGSWGVEHRIAGSVVELSEDGLEHSGCWGSRKREEGADDEERGETTGREREEARGEEERGRRGGGEKGSTPGVSNVVGSEELERVELLVLLVDRVAVARGVVNDGGEEVGVVFGH